MTLLRYTRCAGLWLLVGGMPSLACAADLPPLGRLFTSPAERIAIDVMRDKHLRGETEADAQAALPVSDGITVDGVVRRSSGKATIWINQQPQHADETPAGRASKKAAQPASAAVRLPSGATIEMKPGQSVDNASRQVRDAYQSAPNPVHTE